MKRSILIPFCILLGLCLNGCDDMNLPDDAILPCNIDEEVYEVITDMKTKLYFITPDPVGNPVAYPQGMRRIVSNEGAALLHQDEYLCGICNFPKQADQWKKFQKDIEKGENGMNIVFSGIVYSEIDEYGIRKLELTSLKRIK